MTEAMKFISGLMLVLLNMNIALTFTEEYFDDSRIPSYVGPLQDEDVFEPRGPPLEDAPNNPYMDVLQLLKKRSYPRWYHAFVYRNPTYHTSPLAQSKRFLPFHPLARFRGLSMGGAGGGLIGGGRAPYHHGNYETFVSDPNSIPSPGHPVPSGKSKGDTKTDSVDMAEGQLSGIPERDQSVLNPLDSRPESTKDKINAGDLLRYLSTVQADRRLGTQSKVFRFGIK